MLKKFLILCMCLVTITCVWGLNDRLHYEGFKVAAEHIQGSVDVVVNDVSAFSLFAFAVENFNVDGERSVYRDGREVVVNFNGKVNRYAFSSADEAEKIANTLKPMTMQLETENKTGWIQNTVEGMNVGLFWIGVVVTVVLFLVVILLDFVGVAWGVVESALYLLGISNTIKV